MGSFLEGPSGDFAIKDHGYEEIDVSEFVPSKDCVDKMEKALRRSRFEIDEIEAHQFGTMTSTSDPDDVPICVKEFVLDMIDEALSLLASERQRAKTMKQQIEEMEGQSE